MIKNKKTKSLKMFYIFFALIMLSCKGEKCEGFNLKRIPFDLKYYQQPLKYSNGVDTITLYATINYISKESRLSGLSNPTCDPRLSITYEGKPYVIAMSFYFEYSPEYDYTRLFISINLCVSAPIRINSVFLDNLNKNDVITYQKMEDSNSQDSSRTLRKFSMQKMRVTDFEFLDGKRWYLVK